MLRAQGLGPRGCDWRAQPDLIAAEAEQPAHCAWSTLGSRSCSAQPVGRSRPSELLAQCTCCGCSTTALQARHACVGGVGGGGGPRHALKYCASKC